MAAHLVGEINHFFDAALDDKLGALIAREQCDVDLVEHTASPGASGAKGKGYHSHSTGETIARVSSYPNDPRVRARLRFTAYPASAGLCRVGVFPLRHRMSDSLMISMIVSASRRNTDPAFALAA